MTFLTNLTVVSKINSSLAIDLFFITAIKKSVIYLVLLKKDLKCIFFSILLTKPTAPKETSIK